MQNDQKGRIMVDGCRFQHARGFGFRDMGHALFRIASLSERSYFMYYIFKLLIYSVCLLLITPWKYLIVVNRLYWWSAVCSIELYIPMKTCIAHEQYYIEGILKTIFILLAVIYVSFITFSMLISVQALACLTIFSVHLLTWKHKLWILKKFWRFQRSCSFLDIFFYT